MKDLLGYWWLQQKDNMARAYLKFKRTGTFEYTGGCAVDVDDPTSLKDIWAAANDFMFKEFIVKDREYSNEEWSFELLEVVQKDGEVGNDVA